MSEARAARRYFLAVVILGLVTTLEWILFSLRRNHAALGANLTPLLLSLSAAKCFGVVYWYTQQDMVPPLPKKILIVALACGGGLVLLPYLLLAS